MNVVIFLLFRNAGQSWCFLFTDRRHYPPLKKNRITFQKAMSVEAMAAMWRLVCLHAIILVMATWMVYSMGVWCVELESLSPFYTVNTWCRNIIGWVRKHWASEIMYFATSVLGNQTHRVQYSWSHALCIWLRNLRFSLYYLRVWSLYQCKGHQGSCANCKYILDIYKSSEHAKQQWSWN